MRCYRLLVMLILLQPTLSLADPPSSERAWVLKTPSGEILSEQNPEQAMIPASILKVLTSLYALETLGAEYRIPTLLSTGNDGSLVVQAEADPLMTSGPLKNLAQQLASHTQKRHFTQLVIDVSAFEHKLPVDGRCHTSQRTYNAPLSPFAVNFNTVAFQIKGGEILSAERETPLLPMVLEPIRASRMASGRIALPSENDFPLQYAASMLRFFLEEEGFSFENTENSFRDSAPRIPDTPILEVLSPFTIEDIVHQLMAYSNNVMANQLMLTTALRDQYDAGNTTSGPMGLDEARKRFASFIGRQLGIDDFTVEEGSGLSRKNLISAREMMKALHAFSPYMSLMRQEPSGWYKTGTLSDVRTRAGYLRGPGGWYPYVLMTHRENDAYSLYLKTLQQTAGSGSRLSHSANSAAKNPATN
ncbi:D-alanyl-D-alanine carboxypeptidase [Desulfobotulus sp. H1]|uniref:D-alanyl-D-alanine carboxypeptidase n=1 Tax=Desulfobotulus pelophilus TaxID=2823377 RepID=A0ABT3NB38_9BACT|nr:D-alanyl-D-alanine carboxypeptidase [Desulfobotulus pelophilus]MCW7754677.1 D-alanyl-D-alanine carboxypeptidase [Desulfobotulus pelophilus]